MGETGTIDIAAKVNAEMAKRLINLSPMPSDQAQDEFLELLIYADMVPAVAKALQQFFNLGLPVIVSTVDTQATELAGQLIVRYDLHETVKGLLLAARASDFVHGDLQGINRHSVSL